MKLQLLAFYQDYINHKKHAANNKNTLENGILSAVVSKGFYSTPIIHNRDKYYKYILIRLADFT